MRYPYRLLLLLALFSLASASAAALAGWTLLGHRTVDPHIERDEIVVGAREGQFERIKLIVARRAVTIRDVEIHYGNGTRQDVALRSTIPAGGESRAIDLTGQDRSIARVTFVYDTMRPGVARGVVALYGWR